MWNEFMEWVDEWDNPIPITDEDEDEDEDEEEYDSGDNALGMLLAAAAIPIGMAGWALGNYVIVPLVNKILENKDVDKKNETTKRIRTNNKDKK